MRQPRMWGSGTRRLNTPMPNDTASASRVTLTVSVANSATGSSRSTAGTIVGTPGGHDATIRSSGMATPTAMSHQPTWVCW